jgi:DtxR family Mn-dependent transcriptional regulator
MNTFTEENYLKTIYHCSLNAGSVSTNQIAAATNTKPASVTDMLKKLADKKLINYTKYQGVTLTPGMARKLRWALSASTVCGNIFW